MAFRGWPDEALEFFEGLEADNSRTYWTAHKAVYDEKVRAPMEDLVAELEPKFGAGKIFRPYRDVRFSADKSPYKTEIAAVIGDGYVRLSAEGLGAGLGMWMLAPDQLDRYRRAVADESAGSKLEELIAELARQRIEVSGHDQVKTVPRGYPRDHPRAELLRNKGIAAFKQWPVASWLGTAAAKKRVEDFMVSARPLGDWLAMNVGPSAVDSTR
jgi:uncharacterized protein (TIGR02453 family)